MVPAPSADRARSRFEAPPEEVFRAALETVRSLPGWEVITAHPETGEIHARSRGRLFTPTMDHVLRLRPQEQEGTDVEVRSITSRTGGPASDDGSASMFRALLADRLARGHFGPVDKA